MKRRLALARALLHDPPFVLMDEPTSGVVEQDRLIIWGLLRSLQNAGKTIVLTTPSWEEALAMCDRVAILTHGTLQRVIPRPRTPGAGAITCVTEPRTE